MHSMSLENISNQYDAKAPESRQGLSLAEEHKPIEIKFHENPHILIEIEEFREVVGLRSPVQAGLLVNQDGTFWLTNLGRNGSTEVFRPDNRKHRRLAFNQVAYVRGGDFVGFYGAYYRVQFLDSQLYLHPLNEIETLSFRN